MVEVRGAGDPAEPPLHRPRGLEQAAHATRSSSTSTTSRSATRPKMRWNDQREWVWSEQQTHERDHRARDRSRPRRTCFAGAQRAARPQGTDAPPVRARRARCAAASAAGGCRRRGTTTSAYYRCKFPARVRDRRRTSTPRPSTSSEDAIVPSLDEWLASLFDDEHLDDTCEALAGASATSTPTTTQAASSSCARQLKDCDAKLARYRAAARAGQRHHQSSRRGSPRSNANARALERDLGRKPTARKLTTDRDQGPGTPAQGHRRACSPTPIPRTRRAIYDELGVNLTYHPDGRVHVEAQPRGVLRVRVGGGT